MQSSFENSLFFIEYALLNANAIINNMSSSSNITVENIISSFHKSPAKIDGKPTYQTLKDLKDTLIENAASIDSVRGGWNHGLLGLVVTAAEYIADEDPTHPFVCSVNCGLGPDIPATATQHQIAQLNHQYTNAKDEYQLVNTVEKVLPKQITNSVDDLYLSSMHNHLTGYANVLVATMLMNLFTNYAQIDNLAMDDVESNIRKKRDPKTPIKSMYKHIQTNCDITKMANQPYSAAQKLSFASSLVFKTGMYFKACKEWDAKPTTDKTWANFKLHFKEEQTRLDWQQRMTQQGGYHSANATLAAQATESVAQIIASANAERAAKCAALLEISNQQFCIRFFSVLVCPSVLTMSFPAPCADSAHLPGMLTCPEVLLSLLKKCLAC